MERIDLSTGALSGDVLDAVLKRLPADLSFVDADGILRYYSETPNRIFKRTPAVIGRHVRDCHPAKSLDKVEQILSAFAGGRRDDAQFWIHLADRFIVIRYLAVRDAQGRYLGCLEVSQDATEIRALSGERRLLDWED